MVQIAITINALGQKLEEGYYLGLWTHKHHGRDGYHNLLLISVNEACISV